MKHVFLTIFIWLQLSAVSASTLFYDNDLAGFELASSTSLISFDDLVEPKAVIGPDTKISIDGNVFSNSIPDPADDSGVQICGATLCGGIDSAVIYATGKDGILRVDLAAPVSAVGGIFGDLDGTSGNSLLSLFDGDKLLDSRKVIHGDMGGSNQTFFGWTSDTTSFSALEFMILGDGTGAGTMWAALDDLRFGSLALQKDAALALSSSVSAVPLPAAFWLFLTAISGLLGLNRRRRN